MKEETLAKNPSPKPASILYLSAEEVSNLKVGQTAELSISGKITGISKDHMDKTLYRVELEDSSTGEDDAMPLDSMRKKMVEKHGEADEEGI